MRNSICILFFTSMSIFIYSCEKEDVNSDENKPNNSSGTTTTGNTEDEGVFIDSRDGRSYNVILRNGLWWMIEDFAFEYQGSNSTSSYWTGAYADYNGDGVFNEQAVYEYYDDKALPPDPQANGSGLLYTFTAAVNAAPQDWRLPTYDEWDDFRQWGGNPEAERFYPNDVVVSRFTEIKSGAAPQLIGVNYNNSSSHLWTSTPISFAYPNGDDRDWYKTTKSTQSSSNAHYSGMAVRYVTEEYNFTP